MLGRAVNVPEVVPTSISFTGQYLVKVLCKSNELLQIINIIW